MAVGKKGDLSPGASVKTLKGFYVRSWLGRYVISKSPSQPKTYNHSRWWNQNQFAIAARMAASPLWIDQISAMNAAKGTEQVPRDVLMMAAYGNLIGIIFPDGTETTVADHSAPPIVPESEVETMLCWSETVNARSTAYDGYGAIAKGPIVVPMIDMKLKAVEVVANLALGSPYRMTLCRVSPTWQLLEIFATIDVTAPVAGNNLLRFPVEFDLPANSETCFMFSKRDGAPATALPIYVGFGNHWLAPFKKSQILVFKAAEPKVGDVGIPGTNDGNISMGFEVTW